MSSFFTQPASQRKRKRPDANTTAPSKRRGITATPAKSTSLPPNKKKAREERDESISSGSDDEDGPRAADDYDSEGDASSAGEDETADEKRLRLAQRYLDNIHKEVQEDPYAFDAADVDRDLIAERLKEDVAGTKGRLHRHIASEYDFTAASRTSFTADQNGISAIAVILPHAFTVSTDGSIAKWELAAPVKDAVDGEEKRPTNITPRRKPKLIQRFRPPSKPKSTYQGHTSSILCIAASPDGKHLATGGSDRRLVVWDAATLKPLKNFTHHRDKVLSLSFRRGTNMLYSASADRTCKVWSLDSMGYVQTLFGHQDSVVGIAACAAEKFVSVGSRDRTARLFKVVEEQQLVFRGGGGGGGRKDKRKDSANGDAEVEEDTTNYAEGSIDHVATIDEDIFVTGSDNGSIALWNVTRKKPVFTIALAHGTDEPLTLEEAYAEEEGEISPDLKRPGRRKPRWITALTTIPLADVILTGSWDGYIRVWKITPDRRRIEAVGVISSASFSPSAALTNGHASADTPSSVPIRGIVNDISLVERSERTNVGTNTNSSGLCVVAAVSKNHRLGKWNILKKEDMEGVKNGAIVFEIPKKILEKDAEANGDAEEAWNGEVTMLENSA
jgi:ribosomal RNA-processing protein 9